MSGKCIINVSQLVLLEHILNNSFKIKKDIKTKIGN